MDLLPIILAILTGLVPAWSLLRGVSLATQQKSSVHGLASLEIASTAEALLICSLAFPLGASILGLSYFGSLAAGLDTPILAIAVAVLSGGIAWLFRGRASASTGDVLGQNAEPADRVDHRQSAETPVGRAVPPFPSNWILGTLAGVSILAVLAAIWGLIAKSPYGAWDSWAIWSLRGKFIGGGGEYWRNAIDPDFRLSHPEYPIMLSSFLGWAWRIVGLDSALPPQATAFAYLISLAGMVGGTLAMLRRASLALLAIPALLSPVVMVTVPASLYADLPMGVYATGTAILLVLAASANRKLRLFVAAGIFASLCIWTKEEGLLHMLVAALVVLAIWLAKRNEWNAQWRNVLAFAMAAAPGALAFWWFRVAFALPAGTRFAGRGGSAGTSIFSRAFDLSRYGEIGAQLWETTATLGPLLAHPLVFLLIAIAVLGVSRRALRGQAFLVGVLLLGLLWAGYLGSFVMLGGRISAVLSASLHRLVLHTWPILVFVVFLGLESPESWAVPVQVRTSRKERKMAGDDRGVRASRKGKG